MLSCYTAYMNSPTSNTFENLLMTVTPFTVFFFIFGFMSFCVCVAYVIRLWLVQTATFQIQRDLADIKNHMLGYDTQSVETVIPQAVENGYVEPIPVKPKKEIKAPRKVFIWILVAAPVLLVCLVVLINIF